MNVEKLMTGFSVLGNAMQGDTQAIAFILTGTFDDQLRHCVGHRLIPSYTEEHLQSEMVTKELERIKDFYRRAITNAITAEDQQLKADLKAQVLADLKNSSKPHELGTVAELSAKFGVSKSEIRRRKNEGTLHELQEKAS